MAVAYEDTDKRSVVPFETHMAAIAALGNQHRRDAEAIEALQETARALQLERTELQAQLNAAMQLLTEGRSAVRRLIDDAFVATPTTPVMARCVFCEATGKVTYSMKHGRYFVEGATHNEDCPVIVARAWLEGTAIPAAPDDRQRLGDNVAYWLQVVLGGVQLDVGKRRHAERALREWMGTAE